MISSHFSEAELTAGLAPGTPVPPAVLANARELAPLLEDVRQALGVPLVVNSWYRDPDHNAEVGGVSKSQHLLGSAADVVAKGIALGDAFDRFQAARARGEIRAFGQAIFYPVKGHIHLSSRTGTNAVNSVLLAYPGEAGTTIYRAADPVFTDTLPRARGGLEWPAWVIPALLVLLLLLLLLRG